MPVEEIIKVSLKGSDEGLDKSMLQAGKQLDNFGKSVDNVNRKLPQLQKKTVDGTFAMTNLSRVVQDAPFGFVAVGNNISMAAESMTLLSRQAKESGQSIKSVLISSLTGAGGLGLALSLVTTAVTFASVGFGSWTRMLGGSGDKAKQTADKIKEVKKALDEYVQSLDDVTGAQLRGSMNAQEQLVTLQTVYNATQNANIPLAERKKLVDQLQEQYPKYFKNISDETILAGGAKKAYDELSTAILASARARAAQESLVDIQKQLLAAESKRIDAAIELLRAEKNKQEVVAQATSDNERSRGSEARAIINQTKIRNVVSDVADKQKVVNKLLQDEAVLRQRASRLVGEVNKIIEQNPNAIQNPTGTTANVKEVKVKPEKITLEFPDRNIEGPRLLNLSTDLHIRAEKIRAEEAKDLQWQNDFKKVMGLDKTITFTPIVNLKPVVKTDAEKLAEDVNKAIDSAMSGIAIDSIAGLGEGIGKALSGGGLGEAFRNIGSIIGEGVQALGKQLIKMGVLMQIAKSSIGNALTNPFALIGTGFALTAFGAALKNLTIPGFATGGIVPDGFPNDSYLARLTSGERVIPKRDWNDLGDMMAPQVIVMNQRLRGRDMILQQARENKSQRRGG